MLLESLKDYLVNCTFHGLRFIAEDGRHWTERVFWLICCILSWFGSAKLIEASWEGFQNNAISFVVETTYLNVETSFPSITVCEIDNDNRIDEKAIVKYGKDRDYNLDEVLREIAYFTGSIYFIKEFCLNGNLKNICPTENFKKTAEEIRSPCEKMFKYCSWKNKTFDCCSHFSPINTEFGLCFSLSAKNEIYKGPDSIKLKSSTQLGMGNLLVELMVKAKLYMHSESDVPYYNTITTDIVNLLKFENKYVGISVTDTENEPEVRQLSISQRGCRFPEENYLSVSQSYSYSACVVECRMMEQLKKCNCTSHLMPFTDENQHCGIKGILCLAQYNEALSTQKTEWNTEAGLHCSCLPGCEESEFNIVETQTQEGFYENKQNFSSTQISVFHHSSQRYKRNVVRGHMDLVVSMGGTAGLFVGASLLSFAEFIYFFTLRLYNNKIMKKSKPNSFLFR